MCKLGEIHEKLYMDARYEVEAKPDSKSGRSHPEPLKLNHARLVISWQQAHLVGDTPSGRRSIGQGTVITAIRQVEIPVMLDTQMA